MTSAREQAFRETPRGRFLEAVMALNEGGGYADEASEAALWREHDARTGAAQ